MKKTITFLLLTFMLVSCNPTNSISTSTEQDIQNDSYGEVLENESSSEEEYSYIDNSNNDNESSDEVPNNDKKDKDLFYNAKISQIEINGEYFSAKQILKRSPQNDTIVLLHVKNQTTKDYCVTITGNYTDEYGNTIKTEVQSFAQFYAGFENYFIFRPLSDFDDFEYTLSFEASKRLTKTRPNGDIQDIRSSDVSFHFAGLTDQWKAPVAPLVYEQNNHTLYPTIAAIFQYSNKAEFDRQAFLTWILYNNFGEIVAILRQSPIIGSGQTFETGHQNWPVYQTLKEVLLWPDFIKGEIKGLVCLHEVDAYENAYDHPYELYDLSKHYLEGTIFDLER